MFQIIFGQKFQKAAIVYWKTATMSQLHLGDCTGLEDTPEHRLRTAEQTTMAKIL